MAELRAKKDNKSYRITTEQEKQRYLKEGFDIYDEKGVIQEHSPLKKIAYSEYAKIKAENESLKEKIAELEAAQESKAKTAKKESE